MSKEYPMIYEEFEKGVMGLYLNEYPQDKRKIILERWDAYLKDDEDLMRKLYESTCFRYNRSEISDDCDEMDKYNHFKSLAVKTLKMHIGGTFDDADGINDLKRIEKNFRILVEDFFLDEDCIGDYDYHFPEVTEELYVLEDFNRVPGMYGGFFYFMKLEDGKPILYANASSRMDLDELFIIDEICYTWIRDGEYWEEIRQSNIKRPLW